MGEIFKDIKGYEGLYQVSNLGKVKSLPKIRGNGNGYIQEERILKSGINTKGYLKVVLLNNKKRSDKLVSRLVAIAFIPNPENKRTVNHKKGIIIDNRSSELEWATYSENHLHAYKKLGRKSHFNKPILQFTKEGVFLYEYESLTKAHIKTGISIGHLSKLCRGRSKMVGEFIWKYKI